MAGLSLEQKIGQMIQLEVGQVKYQNPEFGFYALLAAGPEKLGRIIEEKGLSNQYDAESMCAALNPDDLGSMYPFYFLSLALTSGDEFTLDPEKLKKVFSEHRVSSILNMLGSEASNLDI